MLNDSDAKQYFKLTVMPVSLYSVLPQNGRRLEQIKNEISIITVLGLAFSFN